LIEEITKVQLFKTRFILIFDDLEDLIQSPEKWEERMIEDFSNRPIVSTNVFNQWVRKFTKETPVEIARKQLDELGYILDFSDHFDIVVMNPIWLADTFKSILSFKFALHFHSSNPPFLTNLFFSSNTENNQSFLEMELQREVKSFKSSNQENQKVFLLIK
jgi:hypothetical protein